MNLGFAVNRYPEPLDWIPTVSEIGVRKVQFVADLLNPELPDSFRAKKTLEINKLSDKYGLTIESAFTGAFTRVNHFGSLEKEVREHWRNWFKKFVQQSCDLGATTIGGHPGILSLKADCDKRTRGEAIEQIAIEWGNILEYGRPFGLQKIIWEPMSISRELGHTLDLSLIHI